MPVKQAGGGDKAHFVGRAVLGQGFEISGQIGHGGCLSGKYVVFWGSAGA